MIRLLTCIAIGVAAVVGGGLAGFILAEIIEVAAARFGLLVAGAVAAGAFIGVALWIDSKDGE